jgi:hypothetical protein
VTAAQPDIFAALLEIGPLQMKAWIESMQELPEYDVAIAHELVEDLRQMGRPPVAEQAPTLRQ